ncbi:MAG: ABC transporter permease [Pseudomonadota bacterium]
MFELDEALILAATMIASGDRDVLEIVFLSLRVSGVAVLVGCLLGFPVGAAIACYRFTGRAVFVTTINALLALPPVVIGLIVYLLLSNAGPLGWLRLLYSPTAMIIAQVILVLPIITAFTLQTLEQSNDEYGELLRTLGVDGLQRLATLIYESRHALATVILAAFGRAISEVGAIIIVGGNINHLTRTMTTAIALETSKGALALALALGVILMMIAFAINAGAILIRRYDERLK